MLQPFPSFLNVPRFGRMRDNSLTQLEPRLRCQRPICERTLSIEGTVQLSKVDDEHRVDTTARGVRQPLVYDSFRRVAERCPYRSVALGVGRAPRRSRRSDRRQDGK
jgi:hypothetical protein